MSGLHRSIRKFTPKETRSPLVEKIDKENVRTHDSLSRSLNPDTPAEELAVPMADEEEIKRSKRRTASARSGGRASTIFTDSDRLGP